MNDQDSARIATLEGKVAELEAALAAKGRQDFDLTRADPSRVSRRRLMYTGGAVAAGTVLASGKPAAAQQGPPASDVTFVPAGDIEATNVQDALEEVDLEKAALAGAEFEGPTRFADAQFDARPWVDLRARGAKGDGTTDDTGALVDAINRISFFGGGTVLIPPGKYRFTEPVTVPDGVDLWGCGGHPKAGPTRGTILLAGNGNAQLIFEGVGGQSGNFLFAGQKADQTSDKGLVYLDHTVERIFTALRVSGTMTDGIVAEAIRNCTFLQLHISRCEGDALILDTECTDNIFIRAELTQSVNNNLTLRHTQPALGSNPPLKNQFIKCLIERGEDPEGEETWKNNTQMTITAGFGNLFTFCGFHPAAPSGSTPDSGFAVVMDGGCQAEFDTCQFSGGGGMGSFHALGNSRAVFQGHNTFSAGTQLDPGRGVVWESTGNVVVAGMMDFRNNPGWEILTQRHQNVPFETGSVRLNAQEATNFVPTLDGAQAAVYVRNNQLVVAYDDGGTMRYRTMPLTGTSTTWTHSITAP